MSAAGEDESDKSHEPTQQKLDKARRKGEIARSAELSVAAGYAGLLLSMMALGSGTLLTLGERLLPFLDHPDILAPRILRGAGLATSGRFLAGVAGALLPLFALPGLAVLLVVLAQRAFVVTPSKLAPKLSRISPLSNARNKYGRAGLFEFAKSFAKLVIYSVSLVVFLRARMDRIAASLHGDPGQITVLLLRLTVEFMCVVVVVAIAIGAVDFLWQRAEHLRKNRMSFKELRDEHKEAEGDPHLKQARRQRAFEIAASQMMADVPGADVVIVNPVHFAVALKWSRAPGAAPVCVAKGVDEVALEIRALAERSGVPVRHDPPTARALHATTKIGDEIAPDHYRAVAAAIRFAETMRRRAGARR